MFPQDKRCHHSWGNHSVYTSSECLSPNTHPYRATEGDDKNIYYWCEVHAALWTKFKRMTHDEVTILEVLET